VYLLTTVINNEALLNDLITGWLDIGISGATVIETTDFVQLISTNVPIFAGFRALSSGGMLHNKTIFAVIEDKNLLDQAIAYLEIICQRSGKSHQGVYFVTPIVQFGHLGQAVKPSDRKRHIEKKMGRPLNKDSKEK
jgi:nitrogen regulatory protein P-II 1